MLQVGLHKDYVHRPLYIEVDGHLYQSVFILIYTGD